MAKLNRVLIMTHNMAGGGCERVIAELSGQFSRAGITTRIVTEYACPSFYPLDEAVSLTALTDRSRCRSRDIPGVYLALRRLVKAWKPDVVLAMPEKVNVWTVLFLLGSGVPVVVSERNDPRRHPESRIKRFLRGLVYPFAAGFIFQTQQAEAFFPKKMQARAAVLDNPLDLDRIPAPYASEREKTVVSAGRLSGQKNFPLLIEAFARFFERHPDYRLTVYGEGEEREALERLAYERLPAYAVGFPGQTQKLAERIHRAGMFVLPSDFEGMPNVLIEAMAGGLPCIATDCPCGGPASLIEPEKNGLLVPVGNTEALLHAMTRIADENGLAASLGEAAARIRARVDAAAVAEKWTAYLQTVIDRAK